MSTNETLQDIRGRPLMIWGGQGKFRNEFIFSRDSLFRVFHFALTVDQLMFAAVNVRVFTKQTISLLLMFADSGQEG